MSTPATTRRASRPLEFDYVIVGAGSSGCVIAHRLTEDPAVSVALAEAGGPDTQAGIHDRGGFFGLMGSEVDWRYATEPEPGLDGRSIPWPRGRVFGGTSSINYLLYVRGHAQCFDRWAALGNRGWSYEELLPYFKKSEDNELGASRYHGIGGPLNVARSPAAESSSVFVAAAKELGYPGDWDFNAARQEGGAGLYQATLKDGRRHSAAAAFLTPVLTRPNLTALPWLHATQLLWHHNRATGVEFLDREGRRTRIRARREVIVCAGAIDSPKLLLLSGIGPADTLRALGIPVRAALPGVGANLQDHLMVPVAGPTKTPAPLWQAGEMAGLFLRCRAPASAPPDLQFHMICSRLPNEDSFWRILPTLVTPQSRGTIALRSRVPLAAPIIRANYLTAQSDVDVLVDGILQARELAGTRALRAHGGDEVLPGLAVRSRAELEKFVRRAATTCWHPAGTCRMGCDDTAVVDAALRVRGVHGLRVADASIMPELINANTHATCVMIGEKAADLIRGVAPSFPMPTKSTQTSASAPSASDASAIRQTIDLYAAGLRDGSIGTLKKAFRAEALVSGYIGDEHFVKPVQFLYDFVRENKAAVKKSSPPAPVVKSIAVSGNTAVAALQEKAYLGDDYDTNLQLMRIGAKWWIVSKLFNGTPAK